MTWDEAGFLTRLTAAVESFDHAGAARLTGELSAALDQGAAVPPAAARTILQSLRRKRFFDLMEAAAVALRRAGHDEPQIRRQHAQALIDQGKLVPAIDLLEALAAGTAAEPGENAEARGLLGRAFKQLYVDAANAESASPGADALRAARRHLARAVEEYRSVYVADPGAHLWHGINTVALVCRAHRDGVPLTAAPDPAELARQILAAVGGPRKLVEVWDLASAAEACIALDRPKDALLWIGEYIQRPGADAFEIASTLRQLIEVWQLDVSTPPGSHLLPLLQSSLLDRKGGRVDLAPGELGKTIDRSRQLEDAVEGATGRELQKVLGRDGVVTLKWYQTGLDRCRTVAQIQTRFGDGVGTGFLVRGGDFSSACAGQTLLLTNAHVVSDSEAVQREHRALPPADAEVVFEALGAARDQRFGLRLLWTSPPDRLDASLLALDPPLAEVGCFPIARNLPVADGQQKVYVIGHPGGRSLALSLHDNLLLAHDRERLLHYRTPTEGGSSGSPVFNQQWDLIGLHHAGGTSLDRLDGQPGQYAANEGIWIQRILRETQAADLHP